MKIINQVTLTDGNIALELKETPTFEETMEFSEWVMDLDIGEHVMLSPYWSSEMYCVFRHEAIQIWPSAPPGILELCLLRWR